MDNIKEMLSLIFYKNQDNRLLYKNKILTYLFNLQTKEEYQDISDSEFFDIVRETFKLNPRYFMDFLYKSLMKKMRKLYGDKKRKELEEYIIDKNVFVEIFKSNPVEYMEFHYNDIRKLMVRFYGEEEWNFIEKYILEKCCLYNGERILYTCKGRFRQKRNVRIFGEVGVEIYGNIFVTNNRIIVQGKIKKIGGSAGSGTILDLMLIPGAISDSRKRRKIRDTVVERSIRQELPCYGYQFPYKNLFKLKKKRLKVTYKIIMDNLPYDFSIIFRYFKDEEQIDYLIAILTNETE